MLQELHISNYALIEELNIKYNNGFNIITGETGAGKSIILGALGLIMGQRADLNILRDKDKKCTVEAIFDITNFNIKNIFEDCDLDYEAQTIFRREISEKGKSRAFINDTPVTLQVMKQVASHLIDIHSQHENLSLSDSKFQISLVDLVANNSNILEDYSALFLKFKALNNNYKNLISESEKTKTDLDYLQFQFKQLEDAKLIDGEQNDLELEQKTLENAEEISSTFGRFVEDLEQDEIGILARIKEHIGKFNKIAQIVPSINELAERLESSYLELRDICSESELISNSVEHNPARLNQISERLNTIYGLQQKFKVDSIAELVELHKDFAKKIDLITSFDDEILKVKNEIEKTEIILKSKSDLISSSRKSVSIDIENSIKNVLHRLGMPNAEFKLSFEQLDKFTDSGCDNLSFLFSGNKNSELQDVSKVASGGEISRVMLAVKSLIASNKSLPTIIFDEIDTGVSGEIAVKMGDILKDLSQNVQIINITHLPQIAGKGTSHFKVYKYDQGNNTYTSIRKLSEEERIDELTLMLGGANASEIARQAARELLG